MAIDAIQNAKSSWLTAFVKDETVKLPLQNFVEAQTAFTKQVVKTAWEVTGAAAEATVSKVFTK
jgi:hypothetical protein